MTNKTAVRFGYPETLIREYDHWYVLLREPQATLGSLVLCEKSAATEFSAISMESFQEMKAVVRDIEKALKAAFSYDKINYLMLMMVNPNVHFHVIPRYAKAQSACGLTIPDPGWPLVPQLGVAQAITAVERDALCALISGYFQT